MATPFVENREGGAILIGINLYLTLVATVIKLSEKRGLRLAAIPLAATSMVLLWLNQIHHVRSLLFAAFMALQARLETLLEQASKKEPSYADFLYELLS